MVGAASDDVEWGRRARKRGWQTITKNAGGFSEYNNTVKCGERKKTFTIETILIHNILQSTKKTAHVIKTRKPWSVRQHF